MGGAIVSWLAFLRPSVVDSFVLIDSYGAIKTQSYIYKLANELGYNPMLEINNADDYRKMLSLAMVNPPFIPWFMIDVLAKNMASKKEINEKIFIDSEKDSDLTSVLQKIQSPSLVIWGAEDKVLHVDNAELFVQKLKNCSKVVLEGVGHIPMVESPKLTAKYILEFID